MNDKPMDELPPTPIGGDYRPHYNKRDADRYIGFLQAKLQSAEAALPEAQQERDAARQISDGWYNKNQELKAQVAQLQTTIRQLQEVLRLAEQDRDISDRLADDLQSDRQKLQEQLVLGTREAKP